MYQQSPTAKVALGLPHDADVRPLRPQYQHEQILTAETDVIIINRGREEVPAQFDSVPYIIPPGYWTVPYGAAMHFQRRATVPGSRNPQTGKEQSFIGIVCPVFDRSMLIDKPERCRPFSDEECAIYGLAIEAIDRAALIGPGRYAQPVDVSKVEPSLLRTQRVTRQGAELTGGDDSTLEPASPDENLAIQAEAQRNAELGEVGAIRGRGQRVR